MPSPQVTVTDAAQATEVVEGMARVRAELGVADAFPADVLAAAEAAARSTAPEWAVAELALLPAVMAEAESRAGAFSRAALDLVEALVLAPSVGERFAATVVDVDHDKAEVQLRDPAVVARARNGRDCEPGDQVEVVLRAADPLARRVDLDVV